MTSPDPSSDPDRKVWLNPLMRRIVRSDREMRALLRETAERAAADVAGLDLKRGIGASVRAGQLRAVRGALSRTLADFWTLAGNSIAANREKAIADALKVGSDWDKRTFGIAMSPRLRAQLRAGVEATASRNVRLMLHRYTHQTIPLAESVYKTKQLSEGWVDRAVNSALGRGLSARELAKEVKSMIRPDVRGGVSYAAMRLARTELNNAYHYAAIQDNAEKPFVSHFDWKLSKSHPKKDICDVYAADSPYEKDAVPLKPHPQCFCYVAGKTIDEDDFVKNFKNGDYDEYLTDKYGLDAKDFPDEPKKPAVPPKKILVEPKKPVQVAPAHTEEPKPLVDSKGLLTAEGARAHAEKIIYSWSGTVEERKKLADILVKTFTGLSQKNVDRVQRAQIGLPEGSARTNFAVYSSSDRLIAVAPHAFSDAIAKDEESGWFTKTGLSLIQRTVDHEFGHGLHYGQDPFGPGDKMFKELAAAMPGARIPDGQFLDAIDWREAFVDLNKDLIVNHVGTYAATNPFELIAELWAQHRGKHGNKLSDIVGKYLIQGI